ncbi:hypothetical protein FHX42_004679 [Saccharopolyspora lacisalsi]|uniref:Uncharacterized protein n=1 Tax=Halosaccharopolyspora lacisalsi TaxID=1000566 RepID=A0A839E612_9PSEU|nr:hypothetical protein [Halosaccharopolyspora lacisalsi]MBA8827295.1 hypothetical protein [Halosaccharopolyspora lacisalsi]
MSESVPARSLSRRRLLAVGAGVAGGAALWTSGLDSVAHAASRPAAESEPGTWTGGRSANGWPVIDDRARIRASPTAGHVIEGSNASVTVLAGDAAVVLLHVARRFHYEVEELEDGDVVGHSTSRTIAAPYESNYLSGTAIAVRPGEYPAGVGEALFPGQLVTVRDILADCEGVVRWGGKEKTPKAGHFQIDVAPGSEHLREVADKIRQWNRSPGRGAGTD